MFSDWRRVCADVPAQSGLLRGLGRAEDAMARLEARLEMSAPEVKAGWIARADLQEASAALYLAGELVDVEDLALHEVEMDVRLASHALTRAFEVLKARREIASAPAGAWVGRAAKAPLPCLAIDDEDTLAAEFAVIDAAIARSGTVIRDGVDAVEARRESETALSAEAADGQDEAAALLGWRGLCERLVDFPPTLAAAIGLRAWEEESAPAGRRWLGPLLAADMLRAQEKAKTHLPCLAWGLREVARERRRHRDRQERLLAVLEGVAEAGKIGLKSLDRLTKAGELMERRIGKRRSNSKAPALAGLFVSRPLMTPDMAAAELNVSDRAALKMIASLGVRELTGRRRFRAWGV